MITAKWLLTATVMVLAACSSHNNEEPLQIATSANIGVIPTSAECASVGGVTAIAHTLNGDAIRMCQMPNGKQCEEISLAGGTCANVR
ncbi:DUF333 domain-containing protein [Serratia sp. UGAL515B_01]|uniref:putative hemolysin n=1 Tax=Serratia sp. UGAL515B_01 TaxID=2986763 RepID=UPI002955AF63|nr:DUF333 domain-containing protein [Serratia sp. UGAL515B_01]WON78665.1 DUF333 domain-containing protein [Serratia sp. UGAL515B_01]